MCKCNQGTRIEMMPSGEKVFYVDIESISPSEVTAYMERFAERMKDKKKPDEKNYFIPIRPKNCDCVNNYGITTTQLSVFIGVILVANSILLYILK